MIEIKHEKLNIKGKYRCIVISDIHSHLERFQQILKEVEYTTNDYLIINYNRKYIFLLIRDRRAIYD